MEEGHAFNSSTAHSESKQVVNPRTVTLRLPQQAGSPANERSTQRKKSKNGLQPSIDLTFYSELYLKLASPLSICPIFNKKEDKVVCVRKRPTSGNIINDPPLIPQPGRNSVAQNSLINLHVVCPGCCISYNYSHSTHCHYRNKDISETVFPPTWLLPSSPYVFSSSSTTELLPGKVSAQ